MDKETRSKLQNATQAARQLLSGEYQEQLEGVFDVHLDGTIAPEPGEHLDAEQKVIRRKIVSTISHEQAKAGDAASAVQCYLRETAFTTLNRFVAFKMLEARKLVQECVSRGEESSGFKEFCGLAPGLLTFPDHGYQVYLECLCDEIGTEVKILFDRDDPASLLWPRRQPILELLAILNQPELSMVWVEDETIGWVYQYFNSQEERREMREHAAPRNSHELAVRNQFFTPRYVVCFLSDNTLGRIWYEMHKGSTRLTEQCKYLVRRVVEIFLKEGETAPESKADGKEQQTQEELLREPVHIPYRKKKDPRDLRIIDPACGSGHFLLYCFFLLLIIYEEAWSDAESPDSEATGKTLRSDYPTLEALRAAMPALILRHNLHGIDIDTRCAQIAALALWMRAQKAWTDFDIPRDQRPPVRKTNIVVAQPMPGEQEMQDEFIKAHLNQTPEERATGALLRKVFQRMKLAGEAGSLLKIEEDIKSDIEEARKEWGRGKTLFDLEQLSLLPEAKKPKQEKFALEFSNVTDATFWTEAEKRIYTVLRDYAEQAHNGRRYQRHLFVEDAARGFAFIDLCRIRYDVALMNPPFGEASLPSKPYTDETYGDTKGDVYKAFVECFQSRLVPAGYLGILSSRTGFFLAQSEDWRTRVVLRLLRPIALADLGTGVLDAMVEVAAYVLRNLSEEEARDLTLSLVPVLHKVDRDKQDRFSLPKWQAVRGGLKRHQAVAELQNLEAAGFIQRCPSDIVRYTPLWHAVKRVIAPTKPVFPQMTCIRALKQEDKGAALSEALSAQQHPLVFTCNPSGFSAVPGWPFSYWVSQRFRDLFRQLTSMQGNGRHACVTNQVGEDFRYYRASWEVPPSEAGRFKRWVPLAKGGTYSPYYSDLHLVVDWQESRGTYRGFIGTEHRPLERPASANHFFRPGITWPRRTDGLSFRILPSGALFSNKGPAIFCDNDEHGDILFVCGLLCSTVFGALLATQLGRVSLAQSYEVGLVQATPFPIVAPETAKRLARLAHDAWREKRALDTATQTSHAFHLASLLTVPGSTLSERATAWFSRVHTSEEIVVKIQAEIDDLAFRLYGLAAADRAVLTTSLATEPTADITAEAVEDDEPEPASAADASALVADLLDYAIGAAFGRMDVWFATREKPTPPEPDPFDSLPVCPPGMLLSTQGLPADPGDISASYPIRIPWDGILVDDLGHSEDFEGRIREVFNVIWREQADDIYREAIDILDPGRPDLRPWLRSSFFEGHIKRCSKSRRKAPIYWCLSTPSGSYSVWLYYHRFNKDTLYKALNDYVKPKVAHEERQLTRLRQEAGQTPAVSKRKEIDKQETFVEEVKNFAEELARVAPLWNPNLNDGVIINFALLWRLVSLRSWQKECKGCWESVVAGEYDWSYLAMHLWPERVVPNCATDRSLAITHGVEAFFWENKDGEWQPIKRKKQEIDFLVAERSSEAVKAALAELLDAPSSSPARNKRAKIN
jgi:hypothetical protein